MVNVEVKSVELPNGETYVYRERSGGEQIVILVHGNMTSSVHWDVVMEKMDPSFKLYALDMRGFGDSSYNEPIRSISDFAADVKLFVDRFGLKDFSLVGWSLGGAVCQEFCATYPRESRKLLLLGSASSRGYPYYTVGEDGLPDVNKRLATYSEVIEDDKTKAVQAAYDTLNYDFLRQMWDAVIYVHRKPEEERYEKYLRAMTSQRNLAEVYQALNTFNISTVNNGLTEGNGKINNIAIPVMIAWGEHDMVVTKPMTEELREDFGERAVYKELKGCGHAPMIDDLNQLLQVMEDFLAD